MALLSMLLLAAGCYKRVNKEIQLPPKADAVRGEERIAVVPFEGSRGEQATRRFRDAVAGSQVQTLVSLDREAQRRAQERRASRGEVIQTEGPQGPELLVGGETTRPEYDREVDETTEETCVARNDDGTCGEKDERTTYKLTESCRAGLSVQATKVKTGTVRFQRTFEQTARHSATKEGEIPESRGREELCQRAFDQSLARAVPWVVSQRRPVTLRFHKIGGSEPTDRAIRAARAGEFEKAENLFETAATSSELSDKDRGWARYNSAMIHFARRDFHGCLEKTQLAMKHLPRKRKPRIEQLRRRCEQYAN
ncbi:MAG: hypothetical protein ABEL76_02580 [Bradymonadaceae bacterium]